MTKCRRHRLRHYIFTMTMHVTQVADVALRNGGFSRMAGMVTAGRRASGGLRVFLQPTHVHSVYTPC